MFYFFFIVQKGFAAGGAERPENRIEVVRVHGACNNVTAAAAAVFADKVGPDDPCGRVRTRNVRSLRGGGGGGSFNNNYYLTLPAVPTAARMPDG